MEKFGYVSITKKLRHQKFQTLFLFPENESKYVYIAYGKQKKENVLASVSTMSGEELKRLSEGHSLDTELQSIPGVIVTDIGTLGPTAFCVPCLGR